MDKRRWEEIQVTFDTLVELDAGERESRLTALSSTDPELRAAVESLIAADSEADARLAPLEAAFLPDFAPAPDPLGLAGRTISHFQVREPIGAGGMGVVYRAEDTRLGRPVALKFLLPSYSLDAAAKARFLREAHSAAALDHPNLCTIHEIGATQDGQIFFAMALYSGETLKARLVRDGTLPSREVLDIARQVAEGLESAHSGGIVHRDLKPANVMLLPDGGIRILDFGLAKARDQSLSATGARFGTVSYMSPEQIRGASVDGRADLWALGVVIYEMLTGRKPFPGEEEVAVAHAILHDEPILPSTIRGDLSAALEDLVLKLLQKDPAKRYASASEVLADLAQVDTAAQGTSGSLRARWRRAWRVSHPQRRWMIAAFGAVLVLGGALGYTTITRQRGSDPVLGPRTAIAVLPFRNLAALGPFTDFGGGLHHEIVTQLYQLPALKVIGREFVTDYHRSDLPPLRRIATELGVRTIVQGSVQEGPRGLRVHVQVTDASTSAQLWAHTYDRAAEEAFAIQIDIVRRIAAAVGAPLNDAVSRGLAEAPTRSGDAYRLYLRARERLSNNNISPQNLEIARLLVDSAIKFDSGFALAHAARSELFGLYYHLTRPRFPDHGQRQVEEAEIALRLAPHLPQAHLAMARAHHMVRRNYQRAVDEYATALKGLRNDPVVWVELGQAHRSAGNWDDAIAAFQKAVEFVPDRYLPRFELGPTLTRMRRYAEAARAFDQSYAALSPDIADYYMSGIAKGRTYLLWRGELDTLRAALDRTPDHGHWGIRRAMEYARLLSWERRSDSALVVLAALRGVPTETAPLQTVPSGSFYEQMRDAGWPPALTAAWAHQLRGDRRAAHAAFDSALAMMDTIIVMQRAEDEAGMYHAARGLVLAALGRHREALRDARWLQDSVRNRHDALLASDLREYRARIYAHVGDADRALDEIERLLAGPSLLSVHTLRLDPLWDPIREHPRFRALLVKYGT